MLLKRLLSFFSACLLALFLLIWAFSYGLGIWTINWDSPVPIFEENTSTIYYVEDKLVANYQEHRIDYVYITEMPQNLLDAIVAVEDRRFYQHPGVDRRGLVRALLVNLDTGNIAQGGSTITQQLARNIFLTLDQNMTRKLAEISIALQLERHYEKDEILEMYLNQVYFGGNNWGIAQAAKAYFGKEVRELDLGEAALLAGLVQAPSLYAPVSSWNRAISRQAIVLDRMVEAGFITQEQADKAIYVPASQ